MNVIQKKREVMEKKGADTDVWHVWKNLHENPVNGRRTSLPSKDRNNFFF